MTEITRRRVTPRLGHRMRARASRATLSAFAIVFTGILIVALIQGIKPFYGDSGSYWALASSFTRNGSFSLLNFESSLRGYALPLALYAIQMIGKSFQWTSSSMVKIFNVAVFSLIGAVLAPRLAEITWPQQRWGVVRRVGLATLLVVFWSGDLNYPLSDFPGVALALLTLLAIARSDTPGWMLIAGIAGGLAVDTRPAYLPLAPMLVVIVSFTWFHQRGTQHGSWVRRALCIVLLAVGFGIASLPQSLSAHRYYHTWSFVPGAPAHLTEDQLTYGMLFQRYDTFVIDGVSYAGNYEDLTGRHILAEQVHAEIKSVSAYLNVLIDHPLAMAGLLARHVVNGFDMRYSTPYVEHVDSGGRLWLRVAGFLLVFLGCVRVLWPSARRRLGPARWRYPTALLLCCLTSVLAAVETRYMLPAWLLFCVLVLAPGWPNPIDRAEVGTRRFRTVAILTVSYIGFMAVIWHVVDGTSAHLVR